MLNLSNLKRNIDTSLNTLQPDNIPSKFKSFIYLLIPIISFLFIIGKTNTIFGIRITSIYLKAFIILVGFSFGLKDLYPYFRKIKSWKETFKVSISLLLYSYFFIFIFIPLYGEDPQGLANVTYSTHQYLLHITELPFTAIGEEILKVLMFLALLSIIKTHWNSRLILSVLISSFIFGMLHINYKVTAVFPIAMSSIPYFIYLLKYRSIYPLIIAHFIFDFLSLSARHESMGDYVQPIVTVIYFLFFIIIPFIKIRTSHISKKKMN